MFDFPNDFEPTKEDLLTEIRELHFEMSVMQERVLQQYEMIADLSEIIGDVSDHLAETIEEIYKQTVQQARRRESRKNKNTK